MTDAERLGRLVDIVERQQREINTCRRCGRFAVGLVIFVIIAAIVAFIYGAVIPLTITIPYYYNQKVPRMCGVPGDYHPCKVQP
jgi:hypothetical protein